MPAATPRSFSRIRFFAAAIAAMGVMLACCFLPAFGQSFRGAIRGTVTDPSGAVVAGAKLTARNTATGDTRDVVSEADGSYAFWN